MGKETELNFKRIEEGIEYDEILFDNMLDDAFASELQNLLDSKGATCANVVANANISKSYLNELLNVAPSAKKKKISRNRLLDICLAVNATKDEINHLLKVAGCSELYPRRQLDVIILVGLSKQMTGAQIREIIYDKGLDAEFEK